jgi:hypothetical protein
VSAYYHGGVRGLEIGDRILPPSETAARSIADVAGYEAVCRRDRVYATFDPEAARAFASFVGGDVYVVTLDEPVEPDGDDHGQSGFSFCAPAATVVGIRERGVRFEVAIGALERMAALA